MVSRGRSAKEDAVLKRRAAQQTQQKESEGKLKSKLEEAESRRNKMYNLNYYFHNFILDLRKREKY